MWSGLKYLGCCCGFLSRGKVMLLKPDWAHKHWKKAQECCWSMISLELGQQPELHLEIVFSNHNPDLL